MASVISLNLSLPLICLISSYSVKALLQCTLISGSSLISVYENVSKSSATYLFTESGLLLHVFHDPQFIFSWSYVRSTSFNFSVMAPSIIETNSDNDCGCTLEAFIIIDLLT